MCPPPYRREQTSSYSQPPMNRAHPNQPNGSPSHEPMLALIPCRHPQLRVAKEPVESNHNIRRWELQPVGSSLQVGWDVLVRRRGCRSGGRASVFARKTVCGSRRDRHSKTYVQRGGEETKRLLLWWVPCPSWELDRVASWSRALRVITMTAAERREQWQCSPPRPTRTGDVDDGSEETEW